PFVARTITERLSPAASLSPEEPAAPPVVSVPTPSPGTLQVTVTQEDLNQRIEANRDRIRPLDSAQVQITSEAFAIELRAFGLTGRYAGQVVVVDGEVQLTNGRITGPLGWLIPVAPLESALNDQLRNGRDRAGGAVAPVPLQEGKTTTTRAPAAGGDRPALSQARASPGTAGPAPPRLSLPPDLRASPSGGGDSCCTRPRRPPPAAATCRAGSHGRQARSARPGPRAGRPCPVAAPGADHPRAGARHAPPRAGTRGSRPRHRSRHRTSARSGTRWFPAC